MFGPFAGIPAIITGHMALSRIKKSGGTLQGHGKAVAGLVMGYVFTVLIGVIVVSAAGFAAANAAIVKARKLTAQSSAVAIESAVKNYLTEYGTMPHKGASDTTVSTHTDTDLLHVLLGMERDLNKREIRFLSVKEGNNHKNGLIYTADGSGVVGLYDPWGGGFHVRLDLDSDGSEVLVSCANSVRPVGARLSWGVRYQGSLRSPFAIAVSPVGTMDHPRQRRER
jgi:hypothetical protein